MNPTNKFLLWLNLVFGGFLCRYFNVHDMSWPFDPEAGLKLNGEIPDHATCQHCHRSQLRIRRLKNKWPEPKPRETIVAALFDADEVFTIRINSRHCDIYMVQFIVDGMRQPEVTLHVDQINTWRLNK